jgi:hypothetical protein
MDRPVTRHELFTAIVRLLQRNRIASPERAVEILGPPHYTVRLFGIILSERAKPVLTEESMQITERLHPTVADMWLLTERDAAALVHAIQRNTTNDPRRVALGER